MCAGAPPHAPKPRRRPKRGAPPFRRLHSHAHRGSHRHATVCVRGGRALLSRHAERDTGGVGGRQLGELLLGGARTTKTRRRSGGRVGSTPQGRVLPLRPPCLLWKSHGCVCIVGHSVWRGAEAMQGEHETASALDTHAPPFSSAAATAPRQPALGQGVRPWTAGHQDAGRNRQTHPTSPSLFFAGCRRGPLRRCHSPPPLPPRTPAVRPP